jgi:DNA-binding CsgD family transcriptional regulator
MSEPPRLGPHVRIREGAADLPLLQREEPLAALDSLLLSTVMGRGGLIALSGESGIGKTALLTAWLQRAPEHATVVRMRCFADESDEPFAPWRRAMNTDSTLHLTMPAPLGSANPPAQSALDLLRRSVDALLAFGEERPVVLAIDDLQWIDLRSLELLRALARVANDGPLMIVVCVAVPLVREMPLRSVWPELLRFPAVQGFELRPLSPESVADLVVHEGVTGDDIQQAELVDWLMRLCNGNPLYVVEMLRSLRAHPPTVDVLRDGGVALPLSLDGLIEQRLRTLADEAVESLSAAALAGDTVSPELVASALQLDLEGVLAAVDQALENGLLLEEADGRVRFRHQIVREALIGRQPRRERRRIHAALLPALSLHGGVPPLEIARHAENAGELELAIDMYEQAAKQQVGVFSMPEAVRTLERSLQLADRASVTEARQDQLALELADALLRVDRARAQRTVERVEARALVRQDRRNVARARQRQANMLYEAGRRSEASQMLALLLPELIELGDAQTLADALVTQGYCAASESDFVQVDQASSQLLELADVLSSPLHRAVALWLRALATVARGMPENAPQMGRESIAILTELGKLDLATPFATVVFVRVDLFSNLEHPDMVMDLVRMGEDLDRAGDLRIGADPSESFCTPEFCLWSFLTGDWERGLADLPDPEMLANAPQPQVLKDVAHTVAAEFDLARGDIERGERRLRYIAPHPDAPLGEHSYQQWLMAADRLATLELERGDLDRAQAWMGALDRELELKPHVPGELMLQSLLADLDLLAGNAEQAATRYEEVVERARQTSNVLARLRGLRGLATAHYRLHRNESALRLAQQAIDTAVQARLVYEQALSQLTLAEIGLATKPGEAAYRGAAEEAVATLRELGALHALRRGEALLEPRRRGEGPLTARELQIVELVAAGHTDTEIADRLYISRRTVNTHLTNIYGKTDISNRVELVTWAIANGYVTPRG